MQEIKLYRDDPILSKKYKIENCSNLTIKYYSYYNLLKPSPNKFQNWVEINGKRIEYNDKKVTMVGLVKEQYIIVIVNPNDKIKIWENLHCYYLNGNLKWISEQPRKANGELFNGFYWTMLDTEDGEKLSISINGHFLVVIRDVYKEKKLHGDDQRGDVWYELDFETGKIVGIYEGGAIGALSKYYQK